MIPDARKHETLELSHMLPIHFPFPSLHLHVIHRWTRISWELVKVNAWEFSHLTMIRSPQPQRHLPKKASCCGARGRQHRTRTSTSKTFTSGEGKTLEGTRKVFFFFLFATPCGAVAVNKARFWNQRKWIQIHDQIHVKQGKLDQRMWNGWGQFYLDLFTWNNEVIASLTKTDTFRYLYIYIADQDINYV